MTAPESTTPGSLPLSARPGAETLDSLLDELVHQVAGVRHAIVLSADGLVRGASSTRAREDSEQLAAVSSGFHHLARGVGRHFHAGAVRQTLIELDDAFLFVTAIGGGGRLAVFADADADMGEIGYETAPLLKRLGTQLGAGPHHLADEG